MKIGIVIFLLSEFFLYAPNVTAEEPYLDMNPFKSELIAQSGGSLILPESAARAKKQTGTDDKKNIPGKPVALDSSDSVSIKP